MRIRKNVHYISSILEIVGFLRNSTLELQNLESITKNDGCISRIILIK